jgi:rubrerythrin
VTTTTRSQFISGGAKGGLALLAGGSLLAAGAAPALARQKAVTDTDILKLAATAELLAIDFYSRALGSHRFHGDDVDYLSAARANERAHYKALADAIGNGAPAHLRFRYPAHTFSSRRSIAKVGVALETAFVGAYLGAVTALASNDLKGVAAQIGASESQHLSVFSDILHGMPVGPSFPTALTAAQATAAVTPFIA